MCVFTLQWMRSKEDRKKACKVPWTKKNIVLCIYNSGKWIVNRAHGPLIEESMLRQREREMLNSRERWRRTQCEQYIFFRQFFSTRLDTHSTKNNKKVVVFKLERQTPPHSAYLIARSSSDKSNTLSPKILSSTVCRHFHPLAYFFVVRSRQTTIFVGEYPLVTTTRCTSP